MRKLFNPNCTAQEPSLLASSDLRVAIDDLLASHALRLSFCNTSDKPVEAVYTFPIPIDAAFLGMEACLAGETLTARIVPAASAQREYDDAVQEGDSAVFLEELEPGLLCVNLGNLLPGEDGTITLRFVTVLGVADRQARFSLPLVHRPRYGRYNMDLLTTPAPDLLTEHPLGAEIIIRGLLSDRPVHCALQSARFEHDPGQTQINLTDAMLDRDLVLVFDLGDSDISSARFIRDGDRSIGIVTFAPRSVDCVDAGPLSLCLLMDCSGSMTGDAIMQSRTALRSITSSLQDEDRIQVLRFGSNVVPMFRRPLISGPRVRNALTQLESTISANLGGTAMGEALKMALDQLERLDGPNGARVIMLVTDGAVQPHDIAEATTRAEAKGIRIFVVAVGSSAGVDVLEPLTQKTRGALERAVPSEPVDAGVMRHLRRARSLQPERLNIDWGGPTEKTVPLGNTYAGDAVIAVAVFPDSKPRNVEILRDGVDSELIVELGEPVESTNWRSWAGHKLYKSSNAAQKLSLALHYGLICPQTSAVLVRQRDDATKPEELPNITSVRPMLPAGMLLNNFVMSKQIAYSASAFADASAMDSSLLESAADVELPNDSSHAYEDVPAFLRKKLASGDQRDETPSQPALTIDQLEKAEQAVLLALIVVLLDVDRIEFSLEALYANVDESNREDVEALIAREFGGQLTEPQARSLLNSLLHQYRVALTDAQEAELAVLQSGQRRTSYHDW